MKETSTKRPAANKKGETSRKKKVKKKQNKWWVFAKLQLALFAMIGVAIAV